ncbi:Sjoegren syndrome nuclear autoantigen 1 [Marmota monax]|uniref:Sjoegren syndrome nuclear autoantigen 1 n=1 Tax=Marmota monax TaxID=9995 RepID=A0A834R1B7_MARMO|nr:Sjoegren syndrome nuclear autoantigen 1 [Marmota monax]
MTQQGAALQNYNNELVKCIEELCQKREELCRQIQQEEDEKQRLQNEVRQLTEKLARVNENLARKIASRNEFDRTIAETEAAYLKVGLLPVPCWHLRLGQRGQAKNRGRYRLNRGAACEALHPP